MKKLLAFALVMLLAAPCFGAVGITDSNDTDGETYRGEATTIKISGQETSFDGSKVTILANGHKEGVTTNVSTESHLQAAALAYGVISVNFSASRKVYIANGTPGQMVTIYIASTAGMGTADTFVISDTGVSGATATALKSTGWTTLTFNAAMDTVTLLYVDDTYGWVLIGQNSVTVS